MEITSKQIRNGVIFGGLAVATTALILYFKKQFAILRDSCFMVTGGIIHSLTLQNVKMTLFFKIANESDLTIEASDMNFNIYVNNMFVTKIVKPEVQTLYGKSSTLIQLAFEFNPTDLFRAGIANIEPIIYDKEKMVISIKGYFSAKTGIVRLKQFPINENITLKEILTPSTNPKKCK